MTKLLPLVTLIFFCAISPVLAGDYIKVESEGIACTEGAELPTEVERRAVEDAKERAVQHSLDHLLKRIHHDDTKHERRLRTEYAHAQVEVEQELEKEWTQSGKCCRIRLSLAVHPAEIDETWNIRNDGSQGTINRPVYARVVGLGPEGNAGAVAKQELGDAKVVAGGDAHSAGSEKSAKAAPPTVKPQPPKVIQQPASLPKVVAISSVSKPANLAPTAAKTTTVGNVSSKVRNPLDSQYTKIMLDLCEYNSDYNKNHRGVDIKVPDGKKVYPITNGKVVENHKAKSICDPKDSSCYNKEHWNACLIVEHDISGKKYYTYYAHITSELEKGAVVSVENSIGTTNIGHLHLSVNKENKINWGYINEARKEACGEIKNDGWLRFQDVFNLTGYKK